MGSVKQFTSNETVFILERDSKGKLLSFAGPFFNIEIETIKKIEYPNSDVEVIDENYFKHLYPEQYKDDFYYNWPIYLEYFLISKGFEVKQIPINNKNIDNCEINNIILSIDGLCIIFYQNDELLISFLLEQDNPVPVAMVSKLLSIYCLNIFDVIIAQSLYVDGDNQYWGLTAMEKVKELRCKTLYLN